MSELLAFFIGLLVGASGGAAAVWAVFEPLERIRDARVQIAQLETRIDDLLHNRKTK